MKKVIFRFLITYAIMIAIMVIQKPLFLMFYPGQAGAGDLADIIVHGFSMDLATAAYLMIIPGLILIASQWLSSRTTSRCMSIYRGIVSVILGMIMVVDLVLYGYWGFRLDMTPVFYFTTSPASAMASATVWEMILGPVAVAAVATGIYQLLRFTAGRITVNPGGTWLRTVVAVVMTALLFIPIRGGFTVSTMNLSRAYYSQNQHFNHAAINPAFSLLYSASHQGKWSKQYSYMSPAEADRAIACLDSITSANDSISISLLNTERPDVVMIILESFSSHLLPSLGGEPVAMKLDSIAATGWLWDNFYANSFRTDRALTAIMSGFPGVPSASLMKNVEKIEHTPSWPREMKHNGWISSYFYGGDTNFTNMHAYLVSQGFENITSDKSFAAADRKSKWGAHDDKVFTRALADILSHKDPGPYLDIIQTSSSHEPFDVPYSDPRFTANDRLNAFAYTDSCAAAFINALSRSPRWHRTLVIIVPDHYGVYPQDIDNPVMRHTVPLIFTGGALADAPRRISRTGSQADIAATLLCALGLDHKAFPFSRNLLAADAARYAFFSEPGVAGIVTPDGSYVFNCDADAVIMDTCSPACATQVAQGAHAILQELYNYMQQL
ncbi:MAG: sulfatase-like hydrolase/transferase [Duncaniella sp.]|nr:sulfatase-like hydrolase/transferase [Duncaniella sp.]